MTSTAKFTIKARSNLILMPRAVDDQAVRLVAGEAVEVSEHQAVHALGRSDLVVKLPAKYQAELEKLAGKSTDLVASGEEDAVEPDSGS